MRGATHIEGGQVHVDVGGQLDAEIVDTQVPGELRIGAGGGVDMEIGVIIVIVFHGRLRIHHDRVGVGRRLLGEQR